VEIIITGSMPASSPPILGDLVGTFNEMSCLANIFDYKNVFNNKIE
jgi:hypothetical protein